MNENSAHFESESDAASPSTAIPQSPMSKVWVFIATGGYTGFAPLLPGTVGSIAAMVLAIFLHYLLPVTATLPGSLVLALLFTGLGLYSSHVLCRTNYFGKDAKDPKQIVVDEFAGYFVALIGGNGSVQYAVLAFFMFRVFDIIKPPPVRQAERLPGAYGIMFDDVVAGVLAALCTQLCFALR